MFRSYRLRTYKRCFVGSEAVQWLINNKLANSTEAAELLGNKLLELGFIHHVLYEHPFRNKFLFYRWVRLEAAGVQSQRARVCQLPLVHTLLEWFTAGLQVAAASLSNPLQL